MRVTILSYTGHFTRLLAWEHNRSSHLIKVQVTDAPPPTHPHQGGGQWLPVLVLSESPGLHCYRPYPRTVQSKGSTVSLSFRAGFGVWYPTK